MPTESNLPSGSEHHAPDEPPGRFLWCSDCRAPLRNHYFALDERPVCAKCRVGYAAKIARGTGGRAMWRALAYGLGAALAGAALIGIVIQTIGVGRILSAIAIGWMVGRAINLATGDYLKRRYRILAVVLTYFAVGLGSVSPVLIALADLPEELAVAEAPALDESSADDEYASLDDAGPGSLDQEMETIAEIEAEFEQQELMQSTTAEQRTAAELAQASVLEAIVSLAVLIVVLPLLSLLAFGVYGAVVGLLALGYGIFKAWEMTGKGVDYTLSGPYRVGAGPIPVSR